MFNYVSVIDSLLQFESMFFTIQADKKTWFEASNMALQYLTNFQGLPMYYSLVKVRIES